MTSPRRQWHEAIEEKGLKGTPVAMRSVTMTSLDTPAARRLHALGTPTLPHVAPGRYRIRGQAEGFAFVNVLVQHGMDDQTVEIWLQQARDVELAFMGGDGEAVVPSMVRLVGSDETVLGDKRYDLTSTLQFKNVPTSGIRVLVRCGTVTLEHGLEDHVTSATLLCPTLGTVEAVIESLPEADGAWGEVALVLVDATVSGAIAPRLDLGLNDLPDGMWRRTESYLAEAKGDLKVEMRVRPGRYRFALFLLTEDQAGVREILSEGFVEGPAGGRVRPGEH